jgi:CheY-like chemotaxis protein
VAQDRSAKRILCIEDDPEMIDMIRLILKSATYPSRAPMAQSGPAGSAGNSSISFCSI